MNDYFTDNSLTTNYNPAQAIGLQGVPVNRMFPYMTGLCPAGTSNGTVTATCGGQGGMKVMGPTTNRDPILYNKPTFNTSLTWVKGNHTYKFGGDMVIDGFINQNRTYAEPWITFAATETTNPAGRCHPERSCQAFCGSEPLHTASERPFRSWLIWSAWLSWRRIPAAP